MTKAVWLRFHSGDWLNETRFLSAVECGIYINLVAMMHDTGGPIPDDPAQLARLCKASKTQFTGALASLVAAGKIVRVDGGLFSHFVEKERTFFEEKSQTAKRNIDSRWRKAKRNQQPDDTGELPLNYGNDTNQNQSQKEEAIASSKDARATSREASKAFDEWWARYPHKVGKPVAKQAYEKALKRGVDPDELVRGLDRYVAGKPPDRPWCNPATWLNQDRHADEPAPASTALVNGGRDGFGNRSRQPIDWERHAREFAADFARLNDRDPYGSNR